MADQTDQDMLYPLSLRPAQCGAPVLRYLDHPMTNKASVYQVWRLIGIPHIKGRSSLYSVIKVTTQRGPKMKMDRPDRRAPAMGPPSHQSPKHRLCLEGHFLLKSRFIFIYPGGMRHRANKNRIGTAKLRIPWRYLLWVNFMGYGGELLSDVV